METSPNYRPFHESWPLEATQEYQSVSEAFHKDTLGQRNEMDRVLSRLDIAVGEHIALLARTQGLEQPPYSEEIQANWLSVWRKAAECKSLDEHDLAMLGGPLAPQLGFHCHINEGKPVEEIHAILVKAMEAGTFDKLFTESVHCFVSGNDLKLEIANWQPQFYKFNSNTRKYEPLQAGDVVREKTRHIEVEFPTGRLLAADWFRVQAFTDATEVVRQKNQLNGDNHLADLTLDMAREFNIVHVNVGNTTTSLSAVDGGILAYGEDEDDDRALRAQAQVCNDLWWTTIVDESILRRILERTRTREEVDQTIEALLEQGAERLDVEPGTYHLYFASHTDLFRQTYNEVFVADPELYRAKRPYFTLRQQPCKLRVQPSMRRKRSP